MRVKWDRPQSGSTYGLITIQKAIASATEIYKPGGKRSSATEDFGQEGCSLAALKPESNERYPWTDIGASRLFADYYKSFARYVPERKMYDELAGDSNSIVNQKAILKKYAEDNGFRNIEFYVDDGVSGTTFDRPDFIRMIADVESGRVGTIIIKDISRFGRDYLKVGYYTEIMFPETDVRFIAINNSIDSANQTDSDFTPFLNIINEWYAKDTSKKIRAVFKSKGQSGKPLCTNPPYGYIKDPEDKLHWDYR